MNLVKTALTGQFALMSEFEEICHQFAATTNVGWHEKPISHWARQGDRRLPYALLRRSVGELIHASFADLASTPGIGPKKIASLLVLLRRALNDQGSQEHASDVESRKSIAGSKAVFDANAVSESTWEVWRATIRRRGLEKQMLGHLTPSLRDLPTVIWTTTLDEYLDYTLADLRDLKAHGEKRIQTVLEVFFIVHLVFEGAGSHPKFSIVLRPSFVPPIEHWIQRELECDQVPEMQDIRENLTLPLLNQIQVDGGDTVHHLATGRLGIETEPESVRGQAQRLDVTRARIYQQLETCADIMRIRWPEGRRWLADLAEKFDRLASNDPRRSLFEATRGLMFPVRADQRIITYGLAADSIDDRVSTRS